MFVVSGSDGGGGIFFNSIAWARQRRVDTIVTSLGELKREPPGTKRDEV
jgi:hypothetical protein